MANRRHYQASLVGDKHFSISIDDGARFNATFGSTTEVGQAKLYDQTGYNTDGAMTQRATTVALEQKADISELSTVAISGLIDDLSQRDVLIINCGTSVEVV